MQCGWCLAHIKCLGTLHKNDLDPNWLHGTGYDLNKLSTNRQNEVSGFKVDSHIFTLIMLRGNHADQAMVYTLLLLSSLDKMFIRHCRNELVERVWLSARRVQDVYHGTTHIKRCSDSTTTNGRSTIMMPPQIILCRALFSTVY